MASVAATRSPKALGELGHEPAARPGQLIIADKGDDFAELDRRLAER